MTYAHFLERLKSHHIIACPSMDEGVLILRQGRLGVVLADGYYPVVVRRDQEEVPSPVLDAVLRNFDIPADEF